MNKRNTPFQPKDCKINLRIENEEVRLDIDGSSEDLAFLLISAIEAHPPFLDIIKMTIDFQNYVENNSRNN